MRGTTFALGLSDIIYANMNLEETSFKVFLAPRGRSYSVEFIQIIREAESIKAL